MKPSDRILELRLKNVPNGDDWFGCALSEIMGIIDEVAQLEEKLMDIECAGCGLTLLECECVS